MANTANEERACPVDPFCLGMCSWTGCPGNADMAISEPHPGRELSLEPHPSSSASASTLPGVAAFVDEPVPLTAGRFALASDEEIAKLAEGVVPQNTAKMTTWALKNFQEWTNSRNKCNCTDTVPDDFYNCSDPAILNNHLSRFIVETRKSTGEKYPPATLHQLLCGILRHMRTKNPECPNFLDKKDSRFRQLHGTLDSYFHKLHSEGLGRQTKHAEIVSKEDEDQLWREGTMGTTTPAGLQNAAFFVVGKMFCLHGGQEHHGLQLSQLKRYEDRYMYYENTSKNRNGTFKQLRVKSKVVPLFPCPEAGERCPVHILDKYISKLPTEAKDKDLFYIQPLQKVANDDNKPWYSSIPLGKHTLHAKLKNMCSDAGIGGHKTNHSLRATAATELFRRGAPETLIQERTGHRSIEALRSYERLDDIQHKAASSVLSLGRGQSHSLTFSQHLKSTNTHSFNMPAVPSHAPSVNLHAVHICTININNYSYPTQDKSSTTVSTTEYDVFENM